MECSIVPFGVRRAAICDIVSDVWKSTIDKWRPMGNGMRELQIEDRTIRKITTKILRRVVHLMSVVMISQLSGAQANASEKICGNALSVLNEGKHFEEFDKQNGGGEKRIRFRSAGRCVANECKVEVVAGTLAAEKVIATITGRITSYCVYGLNRVHIAWNRRRLGCPSSYLWNALGIILAEDGRDVKIGYMYGAEGGSVALSKCISLDIVEGLFVHQVWRVPLDDRSAAFISETVYPGNPSKPGRPFATSVVGAKNR
jgi:hypothetical protein